MNNTSFPYDVIYIYLTGFNTITDGTVAGLLAMVGYSKFAFAPVIVKNQKQTMNYFYY